MEPAADFRLVATSGGKKTVRAERISMALISIDLVVYEEETDNEST
jgi:hypothetical protein